MLKKYDMLKGFILLLFALLCQVGYAQNVGINDTGNAPDGTAMLDVTAGSAATKKGILIPRMTETEKNAITSPATGLLIYQTTAPVGFYYNIGIPPSKNWQYISTGASGWGVTGNASTTAGTNFIGTTDAQDFVVKTNNTERARFMSTGSVGIGTTAPSASAALEVNSTTQGILVPKVPLTSTALAAPVTSPATGLLVWALNTTGDVTTGFYYWSGSAWVRLSPGGTTSATTNYWTKDVDNLYNNTVGNVGIGLTPTNTFNATYPEKFLVHAGGTQVSPKSSSAVNVINGKGYNDKYLQLNIQNLYSGGIASSDVVATNNLGTEANGTHYVDMGINSSVNTSTDALGGSSNAYLYNKSGDFTIGAASADKNLRFITGGQFKSNIRMKIDSIGNVGIGTANSDISTSRLSIDGGTISSAIDQDLGSVVYITADRNQFVELNIQNTNSGNAASSDIVATADNGSDSTNYIDMGINSKNYANAKSNILNKANVAYLYSNAEASFKIGNGGLGQSLVFFTNPSTASLGNLTANGLERVRIDGNGNVGIGDYSGNNETIDYKLTVDGHVAPRSNNTYDLGADGSGNNAKRWRSVYANTVYNSSGVITSSDRRLKTSIAGLKYGLKEILSLQPVSYMLKATPEIGTQLGLIAQDAEKVVPEIVNGDENKEMLGVNYTELIPVLINAIKEQQKQIEDLKQQVQKLQK